MHASGTKTQGNMVHALDMLGDRDQEAEVIGNERGECMCDLEEADTI